MKIGDVVLTRSFEARSQVQDKPSMRMTFKAKPGHALCYLYLGTVDHESKRGAHAEDMLQRMGWTSPPWVEGQDEGIENGGQWK